jgi:hypothetical protein
MSPDAAERTLAGAVKDLVLLLRLTAEDLAQAEPTDAKELDAKLQGLKETVTDGVRAIEKAAAAYDEMYEEPEGRD